MEIIIKYDIDGQFLEGYSYNINFDYNKSSNILSLENKHNDSDDFLKEINNKIVPMEFRGISKIDGLCIFILNSSTIRRQYKLNEILK
jgi:hypothetical protein